MRRLALVLLLVGCAPKRVTPSLSPPPAEETAVRHEWLDLSVQRVTVREDLELSVMDTGGDGPPVVLVHGLGSNSSFWEYQLQGPHTLANDARLLAVDLPGWGGSDQPDASYTPSYYADTLLNYLDAEGLDSATVVAHSMGAQAAIALALEHPERVQRLILVAPAGIETFTPQESMLIGGFWTIQRLRDRTPEQAREAFSFVFSNMDEGVERLLAQRLAVDSTPRFDGLARAVIRSVSGMLDEPVRGRLADVSVPTLIVFGDADRMIPNPVFHPTLTVRGVATDARDAIPGAQLALIEGAGHTPHHDDPAAFAAIFRTFLKKTAPGEP